ncbi:hydroxyacylglutathione hydrolase [Legionella sp. W05-934-2]|jgi:hydroxyacylglutathione hydrolase|uniref:hydroxyacylglutathione hydrolase n=1 Tax=Legionella sp. W05-934-2 TaxID=1198649 RepID=UPI0034629B08
MKIIPLSAFQDNYIWLLVDNQRQCVCVDPGDAKPVLDYIRQHQLSLTAIVLTHHHFDHIGGVSDLLSQYPGTPVYGPHDSRIPQVTHALSEGDRINVLDIDFTILSIPGHTSTHIAYFNPNSPMLFCGDTLFSAGCGRVFDGTMEKLFHSLEKINQLPIDTKIYCAHEYTLNNCRFAHSIEPSNQKVIEKIQHLSTQPQTCSLPSDLATEKKINPFLRAISKSLSSPAYQDLSAYDTFKHLRLLKDDF